MRTLISLLSSPSRKAKHRALAADTLSRDLRCRQAEAVNDQAAALRLSGKHVPIGTSLGGVIVTR